MFYFIFFIGYLIMVLKNLRSIHTRYLGSKYTLNHYIVTFIVYRCIRTKKAGSILNRIPAFWLVVLYLITMFLDKYRS